MKFHIFKFWDEISIFEIWEELPRRRACWWGRQSSPPSWDGQIHIWNLSGHSLDTPWSWKRFQWSCVHLMSLTKTKPKTWCLVDFHRHLPSSRPCTFLYWRFRLLLMVKWIGSQGNESGQVKLTFIEFLVYHKLPRVLGRHLLLFVSDTPQHHHACSAVPCKL